MTDKALSAPSGDPAAGADRSGDGGGDTGSGSGPSVRLWAVVLAACAGQFLVVLDVSVVTVALPSMRAGLGMDASGLQWVVNGYTLAFAGLMLLGGRAADIFGRKRTFLLGLALFTAASLLGGIAHEPWQLLAARVVQGAGAAVLAPATLTILTTAFPPGRARTRAIATWSAVGAGGGAAGGLVGGVLTDALSWRWVLLINIPVGALVLLAAAVWVPEGRDAGARRRLDVPGALLVTLGLSSLAWGIVRTEAVGWTAASVLWPLAAGGVLLALFVAVEARTEAPLVPLRLFRSRAVAAANGAMFVCGGALFCMWYFMSLYMQNVLHYTPLQAGLGFLPQSLSIVLGSKAAPRLMARFGARGVALAGVVLAGAGCVWESGMHAGGGFLETVMGPGTLMALGGGMVSTPLASVAMSGAPHGDAGLVSGLFNTARTMGGSLGLAVFSTIAAARIGEGGDPRTLASGYGLAFLSAAVVLVLCAALVLFVLPRPEREGTPGES
ncbi:DHA2 family efflux MFS transporter permease subunit [Streptomyces winkii]|uniref:DHA2 family efflux MFS transporter permease subunit n=1 Tax=Streptomyces winkii TaxID=3051178 RepID=UPI0028D7E7AA|nr:DHA2 family efflux MFS transporter permease subunit [Streptomyces sp. DSM 40971]